MLIRTTLVAAILAMFACAAIGQDELVTGVDAAALSARIDNFIEQRLTAEKLAIAAPADDAELLRRLSLDLHGRLPPADQVRRFLQDAAGDKRTTLAHSLLGDPAFGRHFAELYADLLLPRTATNRKVPVVPLHRWLAERFNENRPWNRTVHELLTARGPQYENGAVTLFMTNAKSLAPHEATDIVSQVLLGIRLQCAQCHDHPFAEWKQTDYWGLAAFFGKVQFTSKFDDGATRQSPPGKKDDVGSNYGITEVAAPKRNDRPERAIDAPPRFLTGESPAGLDQPPLRPALADWLTAPQNPWFARAMVNRTWAHFFGRGLVNPIDDLRAENKATHPELLDELTRQFVVHGFDLKYLIRAIVGSRAYQRTSSGAADDGADAAYARMAIKVLTPKQTFDALVHVLGEETFNDSKGLGFQREKFVSFFDSDDEPDATAYRRGIPQLLLLLNSRNYRAGIERKASALTAGRSPVEAIDELYLAALARQPSADEQRRMQQFAAARVGSEAYAGILWTLLATSEFAVNH
jgi:hypothetical protein